MPITSLYVIHINCIYRKRRRNTVFDRIESPRRHRQFICQTFSLIRFQRDRVERDSRPGGLRTKNDKRN